MKFEVDPTLSGASQYQQLFEEELDKARKRNDGLSLTNDETQQLRGRIALLKELLALPGQKQIWDAQAMVEHPER